jgi:voltage-gated potassium channel Kch
MMLTPLLFFVVEYLADRSGKDEPEYDTPEEEDHGVIIAGFGRVGQIIGRVLRIIDQPFTAVERDSSQVDIVRRYGNQVYYGDVGRAELLRAAGAQNAKVYVVAIGDVETSLRAVETAKQNFPHLTIIARARNRLHAHKLMELGVQHIVRETLLSSLAMTEDVLMQLGLERSAADRIITAFRERDERLLHDQREIHDSEEHLIQSVKEVTTELEALMKNDLPK